MGRGLAQRDATRDLRGSLEPVPVIHHAAITDPRQVARLPRDISQYEGEETTRIALQLAMYTEGRCTRVTSMITRNKSES